MVMRKNMMRRNLRQSILKSLGRYIAIAAIIALGAGMFVGLRTTRSDMVATAQRFTDSQNMFDLRLLNTYGWTVDDVSAVEKLSDVEEAEGIISLDAILRREWAEEEAVYRLYSNPEKMNQIYLLGGRMPQSGDECVFDGFHASDSILGATITVAESNSDSVLESLVYRTYTVVGYGNSPLYLDMDRGNTSVGNGSVAGFIYIHPDGISSEYFTEIDIRLPGHYENYTDEFDDAMDQAADTLREQLIPLADHRLDQVREQAEKEYADGLAEYEDGLAEFEKGRDEANSALAEAEKELQDAADEIEKNEALIADGEKQIKDGQKMLDDNRELLIESRQTLADTKSQTYAALADANAELLDNYKTVTANLRQVENGILQIDTGMIQLDSGISQLESGLSQIDTGLSQLETLISLMDTAIQYAQEALESEMLPDQAREELQQRLDELQQKQDEYAAQRDELIESRSEYADQLAELKKQQDDLLAKKDELIALKQTLNEAHDSINIGFLEIQNGQTAADNQFAAAEAKLEASEIQLEDAQRQLDEKKAELESGKRALDTAKRQLADGLREYEDAKEKTLAELAEAEEKLVDAKRQLDDARQKIDSLEESSVYVLDRNTNVGYVSFESNADIVAGVSRVFPAFFLLVAAMVCITTMTRMVDEERTQIGTLKALGYSSWAIISKYLIYAGSSALLGCGLGVLMGSIVFPHILWNAYCIIINATPWVVIQFDWALILEVLVSYTAVMILVTYFCCRAELREVPAELIRPKPPAAGKKVIFELLPFWDKISFLNKVMIRNIFRYRQRLAMMLLGIGGCTALLVTGFGVGDSIMDIVSYQFEEVTVYDIGVTFNEGQTQEQQLQFKDELRGKVDRIQFCSQSNVELNFNNSVKDVYMLVTDSGISNVLDLHCGAAALEVPEKGCAMVSIGAAEDMGIEIGDMILVRNADLEELSLKVTSVFDNNVYNYVIINPETIEQQWGREPAMQTAYITVRDSQDVHAAGTKISSMAGVMHISISQDLAKQVSSMMEAMKLVVLVVVVCAALLAVIVSYNLTNININERSREIATIKVLGFNAMESAAYVFKENLALSAMGAAVGLIGGKFLLDFVMSQIKINMVFFTARITPLSLVLSVILTMLSALAVDFLFYFRLDKINMAEALKSVE